MTVGQILSAINQIAPYAYQESYDNSGLLVGDASQEVSQALLTLDCTEEVVDEAIDKGCNLIIAHHPIIFSGLKQLTGKDYVQRTVIKAIQKNVAIISVHTNLDNVLSGVGQLAVRAFNLEQVHVLKPKVDLFQKLHTFVPNAQVGPVRAAMFEAGAGEIGAYDQCSFNTEGQGTFRAGAGTNPHVGQEGVLHQESETKVEVIVPNHSVGQVVRALVAAHPYEEVAYDLVPLLNSFESIGSGIIGQLSEPVDEAAFLEEIKSKFGCDVVKHTSLRGKSIEKVAFCGGSGSFLRFAAKAAGADIFITSDIKYHEFFDADGEIIFADIGHYESESKVPEILGEILKQKFATFAFHFSEVNTNPVKYLA